MINSLVFGEEPLLGEEAPLEPPEAGVSPQDIEADGSQIVYYIRDIEFDSTGRTRPFALLRMGELRSGERITGKDALDAYIDRKTQLLHNQRVLAEVLIEVILGEAEEPGLVPADLLIHTKDTWNMIILPWFEYDSNTGWELSLKARDYNFLGTMSPLRIDFGYKRDEHDESSFFLKADSDVPFKFLGYNWTLNFDNDFAWTYNEPFYYKNITGLSMDLPFRMTTFTFGAEQGFVLNEKNEDQSIIAEEGEFFPQAWYMYSEVYTLWKIPTGIRVGAFGELTYTPKLAEKINYRPGGEIGSARRGFQAAFSHTLGFGRIDWAGNFRSGLEAAVENANTFNFTKVEWNRDISARILGHLPVSSFFGISGRMQYKYWFDKPYDKAGDVLRGIRNDVISADSMASLNMDFPLRVIHFVPSQWLNNSKLRFFDFEQHWSPFVDLALVKHAGEGFDFSAKNIYAAGGLEIITYPYFMRSFYIRVSFGVNLKELFKAKGIPGGANREIYLGMGHHY
ncbi:MAG: hypothetical protein LBP93_04730 [Treponema sp.]|jgi:hypothetical protein|nr:hypothetical protein [Treponema sp.]